MALILIVDDSPTEIYTLKKMLEKHDHQILTAGNGEEAIELAETKRPGLILMDVVMPTLNGFQATRQLSKSENTAHIPIIIISSKSQESDRQWGLRQGAKGYLNKPVKEHSLIDEINSTLRHSA
ncbi:MAG TPA: two-component system response regulator [Gammaproteobacteria bacterium]|nr:two-component system response regulator [Gammaproteobacteria bacterium]HAU07339.1 two-component system response regulator [Gammaproteobacteria bacterium]